MSALTRWEPLARWNPWKELEEMEKRADKRVRSVPDRRSHGQQKRPY